MRLQGKCQGSITPTLGSRTAASRGLIPKLHLLQPLAERLLSHSNAEPSGHARCSPTGTPRGLQVSAQLFGPPVFDARKLRVTFLPGANATGPAPPQPRRYTLTHNDLTGQLALSIGAAYNWPQVSGWYTRLIRDEVLAEWQYDGEGNPSLHVRCHVSGEERWLAPPALRNYIFKREMPLVLDTIIHADRLLFIQMPSLAEAAVYVHLSSHMEELNMTVRWGVLSQRSGWPLSPVTLLDAWWRRSNAGADDLGTAAAATLPIAQLQQGLMTRTDQERAQELLLDDQVASSNLSRGASEVNVPQQSGLILPAAAQPLAEELQQAGEQPSGLILPVAAQPLAADGCAQLDDDRGIVITPRRDLGQESCTAVVSSSRHIACPQSTPLAQDGDGYTPDVTMRAESGAVSAESSAASMQASVLECSMQDDVLTRPFTVRDIVREWYESGREAVNLRL